MRHGLGWLRLGLLLGCAGAWAQAAAGGGGVGVGVTALSGTDAGAALEAMAGQAGVIFVGQVTGIAHNDGAGFVEVRFGVEEAVLGCAGVSEYSLREWVGLWVGRAARYQVGQRFLMMLHAPGAAGLSAPVGGSDGAIPLLGAGTPAVLDAGGAVAADAGIAGGLAADLKWVQARALRSVEVSAGGARSSALRALTGTAVGGPVIAPVGTGALGGGTVVPLETVLTALRGSALARR